MSNKNRVDLPPLFILEMVDHGYAIARELSTYGIRIVGFLPQVKCLESRSHIPYKTYRIPELDEDLLQLLVHAQKEFGDVKPVLFLTGENYFPCIYKHFETLQSLFAFEMPSYPTLKQMLEKDLFNLFAREHKVKIPVSIEVMKGHTLSLNMFDGLQFPLVIKPKHRDKEWKRKYKTQKAVLVSSPENALTTCAEIFNTAERLVMQEWVPGPDANIHFCLTYRTEKGDFLASACGIKYHQYPALFGNTSAALPIENAFVIEETHRILTEANIIGFCSVEFKKHALTGEFYVIEPTVGRMNRQELFSMPGKENVVLKAYCHLAGIAELPQKKIRENYIYVEENMDVKSCLDYHHYKTMDWKKYFKILRTRKITPMYMSFKDPMLSLLVLGASLKHVAYYLFHGHTKYFSQEGAIDELIKENQTIYASGQKTE